MIYRGLQVCLAFNISSYALIIGVLVMSVFFYGKSRFVSFGVWWFLITLLPASNVVEIYTPISEWFLYLPLIGFCIAAVPL